MATIKNRAGLTGGKRLVADDGVAQSVFNDNNVDQLTGSQGQDSPSNTGEDPML